MAILEGLVVQSRVIGALLLREMRTRFGRSRVGYLWALIMPTVQIAMFSVLFSVSQRFTPVGTSVAEFVATGLIPYFLFYNISSRVLSAVAANQALLTFPVVKTIDTILARAILELATSVAVGSIVFLALWLLDLGTGPSEPGRIIFATLMMAALGLGFGVVNAAILAVNAGWERLYALMAMPLYFTSGIFFVPEMLPEAARVIVSWNPALHGVELFRTGFYENYGYLTLDLAYLSTWCIATLLIGLAAERALRARATTI